MASDTVTRLKEYLNKKSPKTRVVLIFLILGFFFLIVLPLSFVFVGAVLGYASFIGPERYIAIVYPADRSEVPPEFYVVGVSAFQIGGVVDHSPKIFDRSSKINLTIYGLRGNLSVNGRQYLTSKESGTMHIYKLKLDEGRHAITFSTILGSQTIEVLAKKDTTPRLREVQMRELSDLQADAKRNCATGMRMDKDHLYTIFRDRRVTHPLREIPAVRKGARIVYPYDDKSLAESFRCYGDYAVAVFTEREESAPEQKSDTRFHHFLAFLHKSTLSFIDPPDSYFADRRDVRAHVTEKGTIMVNNGSGQIYYREGKDWKRMCIHVMPSRDDREVYTSDCGSAKYDPSAEQYLRSSGVAFAPCLPEFDILVLRGKPFIASRPVEAMFQKKLYRIEE
jgi:hypothetical protein